MKQLHSISFLWLFLAFLFFACNKSEPDQNQLILLEKYEVDIPECSGMAVFNDKLVVVSDTADKVYFMDYQGSILDSLPFVGENLEGVTCCLDGPEFWVVEETSSDVVIIDEEGIEQRRIHLEVESQGGKHGLEGICVRNSDKHIFVVTERFPGLLIEVDSTGNELKRTDLNFAEDYSGIFYDELSNKLWILSDDTQAVFKCSTNGMKEDTWYTGIDKAEGLVVDVLNRRIYLITDTNPGQLYIFSY